MILSGRQVPVYKVGGALALVILGTFLVLCRYPDSDSKVIEAISMLSEAKYKDKLKQLTNPKKSNDKTNVVEIEMAKGAGFSLNPILGCILMGIGCLYLIVLFIQLYKQRNSLNGDNSILMSIDSSMANYHEAEDRSYDSESIVPPIRY